MAKDQPRDQALEPSSSSSSSPRKPYHAPRLVEYGDLRTITRAKGGTGNDGGGNPPSKK